MMSAVILCGSDYQYLFSDEKTPLQALKIQPVFLPGLDSKITGTGTRLKTTQSNLLLYAPEIEENGRAELSGRDNYRSSVALIARCRSDFRSFYALEVVPYQKKICFWRMVDGKVGPRQEFPYNGAAEFTLSLDFNDKTIVARANGKTVGEFSDDGAIQAGYAGIRCVFYSDINLKSLTHSDQIPNTPVSPAIPMKTAAQVKPIDLEKIRDWNIDRAFHQENGTRLRISLNQYWAFQPVIDTKTSPRAEPTEWGYIAVPGYWAKGAAVTFMRTPDGTAVTEWRGVAFTRGGAAAWYRRTFAIPADWKGKKVELVLEDVCGSADIWIGPRKVIGKTDPACGYLRADISEALQYGGENEIRILNSAPEAVQAGLGNVYLTTTPAANFGDAGIFTSVAEKSLNLAFRKAAAPENSVLSVTVRDRTGREVFQAQQPFAERMSWKWIPLVLWTPDTPELYHLELALTDRDGKILDQNTIRFGFREFSIRDGRFFLNGNPIVIKAETNIIDKGHWWQLDHLHNRAFMAPMFAACKKLNINCVYLGGPPTEEVMALADEIGLMTLVKGRMLGHAELDIDSERALKCLDAYLQNMEDNPVYTRHPSQIGFLIDVWYNYHAGCTNPNYVGRPSLDPNQKFGIPAVRKQRLDRAAELYRKHFPDMECFNSGSGAVGRVYGTHIYHTWGAPSTELRAFFEAWNKNREMAVFAGETFLPFMGSFYDLEFVKTPLVTENAARILGHDAYRYRTTQTRRPSHDMTSAGWFWNTSEPKSSGRYGFIVDVAQAVYARYIDEIMPGWRLCNMTGYGNFDDISASFAQQNIRPDALPVSTEYSDFSLKPEGFDNGNARRPVGDPGVPGYDLRPMLVAAPFSRAMANVGVWIFDRVADPLLQNHSGYAGETLEKSVMLFNDSAVPQRFQFSCRLTDSRNRSVSVCEQTVEAAPFEHRLVPISVPLPDTADRSEWTLRATLTKEGQTLRAQLPIQVFARPGKPRIVSPVYLWDPEGVLTAKLAGRLDVKKLDHLDKLPPSGILIVGRSALSKLKTMPDWNVAAAGGLNILFMEQHQSVSPELMKTRTRRVFINAPAHPAFDGLADPDFEFWQDGHSVAPAQVRDDAGVNWSDWGNRNMVASYAFRRPQHGNFLSLLVSGFDLFQTPLLECRAGTGVWIASQLEITARLGSDPAATRLFDNLLRYLDRRGQKSRVLFFGGADGKKRLDDFQIKYEPVTELGGGVLNNADVLIVADPDWTKLKQYRMELNDFVYSGGTVAYWHTGGTFDSSWLPFTMGMAETTSAHATLSDTADGTWLNGFQASELYWRDPQKVQVFQTVPPHFDASSPAVLIRGKSGAGEWIFTTLTPERFGNTPATGKTVRLLSALFTSIGTDIAAPVAPFTVAPDHAMLDLTERKWEFSTDPDNAGLSEQWQFGKGKNRWLKGLIDDGIEVRVGLPFESFLKKDYNGYAWYRLTFDAPDALRIAPQCYFIAGAIDDTDEVYLNGVKIGETGKNVPKYWIVNRNYLIPPGLLKKNGNLLAVRVFDEQSGGGIVKGPVAISVKKLERTPHLWQTPWQNGAQRDYDYKEDIVRMY